MVDSVCVNKPKKSFRSKTKNHLRQQLIHVCCCIERRQKEQAQRLLEQSVGYRDY